MTFLSFKSIQYQTFWLKYHVYLVIKIALFFILYKIFLNIGTHIFVINFGYKIIIVINYNQCFFFSIYNNMKYNDVWKNWLDENIIQFTFVGIEFRVEVTYRYPIGVYDCALSHQILKPLIIVS